MATNNDFKYVKLQCKNMYKYIPNMPMHTLETTQKERLGFYHLILEKITGMNEATDIQGLIQDQEYVKLIGGIEVKDLGIDAVYINSDNGTEKEIKLFNFKYRSEFNPNRTASENDISTSMKFFQYLASGSSLPTNIDKNSKVYKNIKEVRKCLRSDDIYYITLYMVTNEANGFSKDSDEIVKAFADNYDIEIKSISLNDIISFIDLKKDKISSKIIFPSSDLIDYKVDEKSTSVSYVCKISLLDLIRITCSSKEMRETYNWSNIDEQKLLSSRLEYSILYDNVRGYLGNTNYNKNIFKTTNNNPKEFFMFNNGITITSRNISCEKQKLAEKHLFTLEDFQIVNGGQTLRSAYNYFTDNASPSKLENLRNSKVLLRVFKIDTESEPLKNLIAEYTNSQNAISPIDLKSVSQIQIEIERYLRIQKILYIRKSGDVGSDEQEFEHRISKEKFTQILYASQGYPERVSNIKKRLFSEYYDDIYNDDFKIEDSKRLIENYFEIDDYYKANGISIYDQKVFYIIYLMDTFELTIEQSVNILDAALESYPGTLKETRVLLRKDFKEHLNSKASEQSEQSEQLKV